MTEKILSISCLGMLLGYLSGYNLSYSSSLIKLSLVILIINFFFLFVFTKTRKDIFFKNILLLVSVFLFLFLISSIRGNILKKDFIEIDETVEISVIVYDILVKDNTKIIKGKIVENKNSESDKIKNLRNVAIYTFSQENFYPDTILNVKGRLTNQVILLPKKEKLTSLNSQNNGKSFDLFNYWNTKNIDAIFMYPVIKSQTFLINENKSHSIYFYSYSFRNYFSNLLKKTMNSFDVGIVMAMLWGDENNISKETNNIFKGAGVSHVLVLSGYNLSIVVGVSAFMFRKNKLKTRVILSIVFVFIFLLLANTSAPVWRASIMSLYTLVAIFFLKPNNAKLGLWITCFLFFIYSPIITMLDISFHLSFLATAGIIYFYPVLEKIIRDKYFKTKENIFLENLTKLFLVTVSANILIAPYLIYQFGYFKISAIFLSFIITPLVPPVMLFGFFSGTLTIFSEALKHFFYLKYFSNLFYYASLTSSFVAEFFIKIIFSFTEYFYNISPTYDKSFSFTFLVMPYLILLVVLIYLEFLSKINSD